MPIGLAALCLSLSLTSCKATPEIQVVPVAVPVTANLDLLCNPVVPQPPANMTNEGLAQYALQLQDSIKECAAQQREYRNEINRLATRAKSRKVTP